MNLPCQWRPLLPPAWKSCHDESSHLEGSGRYNKNETIIHIPPQSFGFSLAQVNDGDSVDSWHFSVGRMCKPISPPLFQYLANRGGQACSKRYNQTANQSPLFRYLANRGGKACSKRGASVCSNATVSACFNIWQIVEERLAAREVHLYAQTPQSPACFNIWQSCQLHVAFSNASTLQVTKIHFFDKEGKAPKHHHCTNNTKRSKGPWATDALHFGALGGISTGKKQLQDRPLPTPTVGIDIVEPIILLRFICGGY